MKIKTIFFLGLSSIITLTGCANNPASNKVEVMSIQRNDIPNEKIEDFALMAMMSLNSYNQSKKGYFKVEKLGWERKDLNGDMIKYGLAYQNKTGLAMDVYQKQGTNQYIIAFRGSNSLIDWANNFAIISPQYKSAHKQFLKFFVNHRQDNIILTGHSLGGGIALSLSGKYKLPAITYNPSPRVFDGWGAKPENALREIIYHQKDKRLNFVREHIWKGKQKEYVNEKNRYAVNYNFHYQQQNLQGKWIAKEASYHSGQLLALRLLEDASKTNATYKEILMDYQKDMKIR